MIFSKSAKNRLKIFSLIAIAATIIFFFIYNNLQKNVVYFYAPQEIKNLTKITDSKNTIKTKIDKLKELETINLIPIFEYISYNNVELYDFSKIDVNDVDTTNSKDLERFVLSHVYYLTQSKA